MSEKDEINPEVVEQLKASEKLRGPIDKVVLAADGKTLVDGHQRKAADPDWPEEVNPKLKTEEDCVLFDIDKNWNRTTKTENWKRSRITRLAKLGNTVQDIVKKTGFKEWTIYNYYPDELKDQTKAAAGKVGGPAASVVRVTTQLAAKELDKAEGKALEAQIECSNCHLGFPSFRIKVINDKPYCPKCAPYVKEIKPTIPEEKKPVVAESWEERKKHMQTADPEVDRILFQRLSANAELRDSGWRVEYHQKHIASYVEDDVCLVNNKLGACLAVFFDGSVHNAKRKDKDEVNRDKAEQANDGLSVLTLPYKSSTDKEFGRLESAVLEKARALGAELEKWQISSSGEATEESS